ncbi:hypothetical protein JBE27_44925 [Streptomyces albiflaviniger]|nr:hypothetical protein [Streptomyces albiflaviniger]
MGRPGIAKNAVRDAIGYARDRARAIRHSGVGHAVQDPFVQHTVGEMAALGYGAEATVAHAPRGRTPPTHSRHIRMGMCGRPREFTQT